MYRDVTRSRLTNVRGISAFKCRLEPEDPYSCGTRRYRRQSGVLTRIFADTFTQRRRNIYRRTFYRLWPIALGSNSNSFESRRYPRPFPQNRVRFITYEKRNCFQPITSDAPDILFSRGELSISFSFSLSLSLSLSLFLFSNITDTKTLYLVALV